MTRKLAESIRDSSSPPTGDDPSRDPDSSPLATNRAGSRRLSGQGGETDSWRKEKRKEKLKEKLKDLRHHYRLLKQHLHVKIDER